MQVRARYGVYGYGRASFVAGLRRVVRLRVVLALDAVLLHELHASLVAARGLGLACGQQALSLLLLVAELDLYASTFVSLLLVLSAAATAAADEHAQAQGTSDGGKGVHQIDAGYLALLPSPVAAHAGGVLPVVFLASLLAVTPDAVLISGAGSAVSARSCRVDAATGSRDISVVRGSNTGCLETGRLYACSHSTVEL